MDDLENVGVHSPDLIVEVAHPCISQQYGELFLRTCDYYMGSPTAMADEATYGKLLNLANSPISSNNTHGALYTPVGALWGAEDLQRMADRGSLKKLKVTMKKHPSSLKLQGRLKDVEIKPDCENLLYDGPVKELCPLAPNNVNTMACAAIAGHNLGIITFSNTMACAAIAGQNFNFNLTFQGVCS